MEYNGIDYYGDPKLKSIIEYIGIELGSIKKAESLPYEVIYRVISHTDSTHFITSLDSIIKLVDIVGPYSVYAEDRSFLYTMNLHSGSFGETLIEQDYLFKVPNLSSLFVTYLNTQNTIRNIQLIKY